jgi:hypothetical protein
MSTSRESIIFKAKFNNALLTGLAVNIKIYRGINGSRPNVLLDSAFMEEIGDGIYWYGFEGFESFNNYVVIFDAGTNNIDGGRYQFGDYSGVNSLINTIKDNISNSGGGTAVNREMSHEQMIKLKEALKFDVQEEKIIKTIKDTLKEKKPQGEHENQHFKALLKNFSEIKEDLEEMEEQIESLKIFESLISQIPDKINPNFDSLLKNIPEKRIIEIRDNEEKIEAEKEKTENLKTEFKNILEFLEKDISDKKKIELLKKSITKDLKKL